MLRSNAEYENAPFPELLDQEWKVFQLNEHTAQSPPVDGRSLRLLYLTNRICEFSFIVHIGFLRIYIFETCIVKVFLLPHGSLIEK